jgi:serine/threonine protein phosphatase 1
MSKWRPSENCIYVIPDIHGMDKQLSIILKRILPLRKTGTTHDTLIFLGDYIDRRINSHKVIDMLIEVKSDFPDQVVCLKGNHELMLLNAIKPKAHLIDYQLWMDNGGDDTFLGYLQRKKSEITNPYLINRTSIDYYIPEDHLSFFNSLLAYYETPEYIFVHGGCDPFLPMDSQSEAVLTWDRSVYRFVQRLAAKKQKCPWEKTVVTGHNSDVIGFPFVHDRFMMLDGNAAGILYIWELNSRTGFSARKGNNRLVKEVL